MIVESLSVSTTPKSSPVFKGFFSLFLDTFHIQGIWLFLLFPETFGKGFKVRRPEGWKARRLEGVKVRRAEDCKAGR